MTKKAKPINQQVKDCLKLIDEQSAEIVLWRSRANEIESSMVRAENKLSVAERYITRWRDSFDIADARANTYISIASHYKAVCMVSIAFNILVIASIIWKGL